MVDRRDLAIWKTTIAPTPSVLLLIDRPGLAAELADSDTAAIALLSRLRAKLDAGFGAAMVAAEKRQGYRLVAAPAVASHAAAG